MATKTTIQAVKGTRDFYPEAMAFRTWLYDQVRSISEQFGYEGDLGRQPAFSDNSRVSTEMYAPAPHPPPCHPARSMLQSPGTHYNAAATGLSNHSLHCTAGR